MLLSKEQQKFLDFATKGDFPDLVHRGLLRMNLIDPHTKEKVKTPVYLCEIIEEQRERRFVSVYKPHSINEPWTKRYNTVDVKQGITGTTTLARIAQDVFGPSKVSKKRIEEMPVFVAPLLIGVDTFTGASGLGFWEREQDRVLVNGTKTTIEHGKRTGVFICLSTLEWAEPVVPTGDLVSRSRAQEALWYP